MLKDKLGGESWKDHDEHTLGTISSIPSRETLYDLASANLLLHRPEQTLLFGLELNIM